MYPLHSSPSEHNGCHQNRARTFAPQMNLVCCSSCLLCLHCLGSFGVPSLPLSVLSSCHRGTIPCHRLPSTLLRGLVAPSMGCLQWCSRQPATWPRSKPLDNIDPGVLGHQMLPSSAGCPCPWGPLLAPALPMAAASAATRASKGYHPDNCCCCLPS